MGLNKESKNTSSSTSWVKVVLGLVATGLLVWGLITFTLPKNKLEPYNKFKKTAATLESPENEKPTSTNIKSKEPLSKTKQTEPSNSIKKEVSPSPEKPFEKPKSKAAISPEALQFISKGMELTEKGKYELADVQFEKAAELSPDSPEVYSIWGASLRMQKKFKGANRRFEKALQLAPNDSEITFNWGLSRLHEKKSDEAIKLFKKTVELDPKHYLAYNYLGKSYGLKKDFKNEEANYVKALEIKDDFAQGHFNLGIVRSLQKKFEKAAPHFQKAIELDKQYEKPFVVQFLTAMGLKNPGKGMKKAPLKPSPKKSDKKKETTKTAKLDEKAKKEEGSDHKQEGSDGSAAKIVNPITNIKGSATINGEPVDSRGIVYLETTNKLKVPDQTSQKIKIFQRNMQFVPSNSVVMVGSTITFVNDDREVHNIYSKSLNNQFNLGAMAAGTGKEIKLSQPGPVILRCNIHKDMLGTLFVAPNGYFARTNENGEFHFDKVKSQEYIMTLWHPRLFPEEVQKHAKGVSLTGVDQTLDITIKSVSQPDEVHDLVDETDYNLVVDNIEEEVSKAIRAWKDGKKYLSRKRMLIAITKYYDGAGLKGAISKSFSENRGKVIEDQLDSIRKQISGLNKKKKPTEESLKFEADRVIAQLRNNVQELKNRLNPTP